MTKILLLILVSLAWSGKPVFLWKISDANSSIYLLGSAHMATEEFYPMPKVVEDAFAKSSELALEINSEDSLIAAQVQALMMKHAFYPKGDRLDLHVPNSLLDRMDSICRDWKILSGSFYGMKPWMTSITLGLVALQRLGMNTELGIDKHFATRAMQRNMKILSLEKAEEQLSIFYEMPDSLQYELLDYTLKDIGQATSMMDSLQKAWLDGDTLAMEHIAMREFEDPKYLPLKKRLYEDRNYKMAQQLSLWLKKDRKVFVVVGSAHTVGKDGIPQILRKNGYTAVQLSR